MKSSISTTIKKRERPNDVFLTPPKLAKKHIDMIDVIEGETWYDPFKNSGNYYNQFPSSCSKEWSEILEGKDFFEQDVSCDVICSNPPYSMIDKVLERSVDLKPRVISYLIGVGNLTARRIEYMNNCGYSLTKIHMCKVFKWYGMSFIVVFEKTETIDNLISFDRTVWK